MTRDVEKYEKNKQGKVKILENQKKMTREEDKYEKNKERKRGNTREEGEEGDERGERSMRKTRNEKG